MDLTHTCTPGPAVVCSPKGPQACGGLGLRIDASIKAFDGGGGNGGTKEKPFSVFVALTRETSINRKFLLTALEQRSRQQTVRWQVASDTQQQYQQQQTAEM